MDIAATILAGLTLLSVPFLLWFGSKARARREREIADIEALVEERSHMLERRSRELSELHSRLDALERRDSRWESVADEEEPVSRFWFSRSPLWESTVDRDTLQKRHSAVLEALYSEPEYKIVPRFRVVPHHYSADLHQLEKTKTAPEWVNDAGSPKPTATEDPHRKSRWRPGNLGPLGSPV